MGEESVGRLVGGVLRHELAAEDALPFGATSDRKTRML